MSARYAIYYAPNRDDPLTARAEAWLGRSAWDGKARTRPAFPDLADLDLDALTEDPRHYGFHATVRAPFELAAGASEGDLLALAQRFAMGQAAFSCAIAPAAIDRYIAFRPSTEDGALYALHAAAMEAFQPVRAPLSEADIARRRKARLTPLQDERLFAYGYPYIFEDFRFHMTLTGAVKDEGLRARIVAALVAHFADLSGPHRFGSIAVFKQETREAPFLILAAFPFGA